MSNAKIISTKITAIKNTQKITKAMEMVAASKMRKTQARMEAMRPYAANMLKLINHIANSDNEYQHPYFIQRTVHRVAYLVISTDRGLCGSLNNNLFRKVLEAVKKNRETNIDVDFAFIGRKAASFFRGSDANIIAQHQINNDMPSLAELVGIISVLLQAYKRGEIDAIYIAGNQFVNVMQQMPAITQLLPIKPIKDDLLANSRINYLYEPNAHSLLSLILQRYIESQIYQTVVENIASEQAARMVAMKSATDNGTTLVETLQLMYNKARQAGITQELSEIVSGAAAI